jgi:hypothetical protein
MSKIHRCASSGEGGGAIAGSLAATFASAKNWGSHATGGLVP